MRFGRKAKAKPLGTIEQLEDLLVGISGATYTDDGSLTLAVKFRAEKRRGEVRIRCAEVAGVGAVAHVTSPIQGEVDAQRMSELLDKAAGLSVGDFVVVDGVLMLRATIALAEATYDDVVALFEPLAVAADEFSRL